MHSCDSQTALRQNPARVPASLLPGLPGIVVALCLVLAGCNDTPHKAETDEPLTVAAVKPERRNVPLLVESTGMTQAVRTADIVARVEGTLQKIAYADGALVQEGDTLFVIDPTMYKAKRQQAEATLAAQKAVRNRAAVEYARNQKLYAERAASQATVVSWREQLSNAEAQVAAAQAALTQAGIELGYTVIKAPFTGRVSRHKVDVGNVISPQTGTLASIVSQDPVYANFTAPADSILPLLNSFDDAKSIPLELAVGDGPYSIKGKLDYISPQVDASSGTLALRGVFPNTDGKLLPGLFVRVQVPTERENEVMVIPRQAVLENQGKSFVYVIAQDSRARMVPPWAVTVLPSSAGLARNRWLSMTAWPISGRAWPLPTPRNDAPAARYRHLPRSMRNVLCLHACSSKIPFLPTSLPSLRSFWASCRWRAFP